MNSRPLVLSVDWDYFLPRSIYDFYWTWPPYGKASGATLLWQKRAFTHPLHGADQQKTAYDLLRVDEVKVERFWGNVLAGEANPEVRVCDSHEELVDFTQGWESFDLINFDAHHDVVYSDKDPQSQLNSGNWVGCLRQQGRLNSYTLVYPRWRQSQPERCNLKLPDGIDHLVYGDWHAGPICPERVFVCRSSAWMPSWCDDRWLQLIALLRKRAIASETIMPGVLEPRVFDPEQRPKVADRKERNQIVRGEWLYDELLHILMKVDDVKAMITKQECATSVAQELDLVTTLLRAFGDLLLERGMCY